ncbi:MAG: VOC family protein [Pseudodonghicola sp.]
MPKAVDLAYVIYQAPDLDKMETFMQDFGLLTAEKHDDVLFLRGGGTAPVVHVTCRGESKFIGGGLIVSSKQDLDELAAMEGSGPVEAITDMPGGGWRVRMQHPDGLQIDAVWGQTPVEPVAHRPSNRFNWGDRKERVNQPLRPRREPGLALKLGHFVMKVRNHAQTLQWMQDRFGMLASDSMIVPEDDKIVGTFIRFDLGDTPVDHHAILINEASEVGCHHCAFEMQDIDAVMGAHDHLTLRGYHLDIGVGRHLIGSQIFDYWRDPFGNRIEHYTDGDVNDAEYEGKDYFLGDDGPNKSQWGMDPTPEFFR